MYRYSQESSYNRSSHDHEVHYHNYFGDNNHHHQQQLAAAASNASSLPIEFLQCHMGDHDNGAINDADVDEDQSQLDPAAEDKICDSSYNSKKRGRVLEGVQKGKRSVRVKRSQSLSALGGDDDEKENDGIAVDISTMLEEAVQYVKFLQLQIKLLSSDEHWMYAPIAYNGMNIGLNFQFK
uniref:Uncharacterized protein n=1 Tax=Chenopodium quinoa TaxID=63459 RepID=A0A803MS39_CHEQI